MSEEQETQEHQESFNIELDEPVVQQQEGWTMQDEQLNETESFEHDCVQQEQAETFSVMSEGRDASISHASEYVMNPDFFHEEELH